MSPGTTDARWGSHCLGDRARPLQLLWLMLMAFIALWVAGRKTFGMLKSIARRWAEMFDARSSTANPLATGWRMRPRHWELWPFRPPLRSTSLPIRHGIEFTLSVDAWSVVGEVVQTPQLAINMVLLLGSGSPALTLQHGEGKMIQSA